MIATNLLKSVVLSGMKGELTKQLLTDDSIFDFIDESKIINVNKSQVPWDIPENWGWIKFGDLVDFNMGKTPQRSDSSYWGNDFPWISISDMSGQPTIYKTKEKITHKAYSFVFSNNFSKMGTLIMSFKLTVGRTSILGIDAVHNEAIISIYPKKHEQVQKKYLFYMLPYLANLGDKKDAIKGKTLNKRSIFNLLIPLPPIAEQKRITEKLEKLQPLINSLEPHEKELKILENEFPHKLKQSVLLNAFEGKIIKIITKKEEARNLKKDILLEKANLIKGNIIRKEKKYPASEDESITIPDNWESLNLEDIVHFAKPNKEKFIDEQVYLDVRSIREENYSKRRKSGEIVNPGDLAILVDGQNSGEIFEIKERGILGSTLRKIIINPQIHKEYALLILEFYKNKFRDNKRGSAIPHLDFQLFNTSIVPLPSLSEQIEIVEKVNEILKIIIFEE